jgi:hypothetical protein
VAEATPNLPPGYDDTPIIPGQRWKVHDRYRPQPPVVTPPTEMTQERPGKAPSDAVILFDGTSLDGWVHTGKGTPASWKVENGYMEVAPKSGGIETRQHFGDCQLHLELCEPAVVKGEGQGRGNSGVFPMGRYEIQVLDCYNNLTYPDGTSAAIYGEFPPLANACRPPGVWSTYDIIWVGPRFDGEKFVSPARVTVFFNGIVVHHDVALIGPTTHRKVLAYSAHPPVGPLHLQDHGDLLRYRNIWYRPLKGYDEI